QFFSKFKLILKIGLEGRCAGYYKIIIYYSFILVVVKVCPQVRSPPFFNWSACTNRYPILTLLCNIIFLHIGFISVSVLFKNLVDDISCSCIIQSCIYKSFIAVGEFNVMSKLRLQVRVALLKSVFIKEKNEWIQILVIGSLYSTAIVQHKTIFITWF